MVELEWLIRAVKTIVVLAAIVTIGLRAVADKVNVIALLANDPPQVKVTSLF